MTAGYYRMHRGWMDNPVFPNERFTKREAWLWLIEHAAWKDTVQSVGTNKIEIRRGQYATTVRYLAQAWQWSKSNVERFLAQLRRNRMVITNPKTGTASGTACTVITLCNYDVYQTDTQERGTENGTNSGQARDKEEEGKEVKQDNDKYAFGGDVIRLNHGDLARWQKSYSNIPNLVAQLQSRDAWLATQPEADRRKWPFSTSAWLARKDAEFAKAAIDDDPYADSFNGVETDSW